MLPDFTPEGDLPVGVHIAEWEEFATRFGTSTPRRKWLLGRLQAVLSLAAGTGKLRRVFVRGSFVSTKASPKDFDLLLIVAEDFERQSVAWAARVVFDSVQARLLYESDVFWARDSIGDKPWSYGLRLIRFPEVFGNAVSWD